MYYTHYILQTTLYIANPNLLCAAFQLDESVPFQKRKTFSDSARSSPHSVFPSTISERRPSAETKATQQCYQLYVVDCQIWLWKQWWTTWLSNISSAACIVSLSFEKKSTKLATIISSTLLQILIEHFTSLNEKEAKKKVKTMFQTLS